MPSPQPMNRIARAVGLLLIAVLTGTSIDAQTAPTFAGVFGSHMVLPHDEPVILRGQAAPNSKLLLEVNEARYSFSSDNVGQWSVRLAPLHPGGPYTLTVKDEHGGSASLTDVLAGEVWLCSGQSNMEFPVTMAADAPASALQGHPAIRLLSVPQRTSLQAQGFFSEPPAWQIANADTIKRFSALCYFFAQQKIAAEGLPLGLINASWGGSAIEAWIGEQQLATLPADKHLVQLLQQYRTDQRKAELAFADDWMQWWQTNSQQGPVWQRGVLDNNPDWQAAPLVDYRTYPDPRLKTFTGNLWFSKSFELTEAQSKQGASFVLGKIDEVDSTWLNGKFVNNSFGYGTRREYRLESGMLQAGTNQFSVFVTNTYDAGGMMGPEADIGIRFDDGEFVPLGSNWKYRFVPKQTGYPPRAPWESVHGISGMFYGMIAPLQALPPTGVLWYQGESNADNAGEYGALLTALIKDWRHHFNSELPFIVVQLPNYGAEATAPGESGWATLRNAQQQVALNDAKVGLVVTQDLGNDADIHPKLKYAVAARTLQVARELKGNGAKNGIVAQVVATKSNAWVLEFQPPLMPNEAGHNVAGFSLCQANTCVAAKAVQQGNRVEIVRDPQKPATTLRYCWSDGGTCELKALSGLPVSSFELPLAKTK
ncbi:MAG TPA: sialate O-acetylesterase [Candidatus Acidoferrum sp.]|nr:sialate O-acetylesterase [Candidatus Acidoferrum sp.]